MKSPLGPLKIVAVIVATTAVLWCGAVVYSGMRAEDRLQAMAMASEESPSYRLRNVRHERGWLSSQGSADLVLINECLNPARPEWLKARVTYQLNHAVFPIALAHLSWTIESEGEDSEEIASLLGLQRLEGQGQVRLTGDVHTEIKLPRIQSAGDTSALEISPSAGSITMGDDTLQMRWRADAIRLRNGIMPMTVDGLGIDIDFSSVRRGLGKGELTIDKLGTSEFTAEGASLVSRAQDKAGRLDLEVLTSLRSAAGEGKKFEALSLDFGVRGLHAASADHLFTLAQTSCNFQRLTQKEQGELRNSVRKLLLDGFSFGVTRIAGKVNGGDMSGEWMTDIAKSRGTTFSLRDVLSSKGRFSINGQGINPEQKQTLVSLGYAKETPEGVSASYDYAKGSFKLNGNASNAAMLDAMIERMDQQIRALLIDRPMGGDTEGGGLAPAPADAAAPKTET